MKRTHTKPLLSRRHLLAAVGATAGCATLPENAVGKTDRLKITKVDMFRVAVPMQDDIIYSPEYTAPEHLTRLRDRGVGRKRSLALREFEGIFPSWNKSSRPAVRRRG